MPRLPRLSGLEAVRALQRLGFEVTRQRGSHIVMRRGASGCASSPITARSRLARWQVRFGRRVFLWRSLSPRSEPATSNPALQRTGRGE